MPELLASAEQHFGDAPAIVTTQRSESFRELARATRSAAMALRRRGLDRGDRVLMAAANSPSLIHVWLGAIWAGGIPAAVNPELTASEIDYVREDLRPAVTLLNGELEALQSTVIESDAPPRARHAEPGRYTWWDYRAGNFHKNFGMRIDHLLVNEALKPRVLWAEIDREARKGKPLPSDHAPLLIDIDEPGCAVDAGWASAEQRIAGRRKS